MFGPDGVLDGTPLVALQEMCLRIGRQIRYPDVAISAGPLDQTTRTLTDARVLFAPAVVPGERSEDNCLVPDLGITWVARPDFAGADDELCRGSIGFAASLRDAYRTSGLV